MIELKAIQQEAEAELKKEFADKAKAKIKAKMRDLETAKRVVANLERELQDVYAEIGTGAP